MIAESVDYVLMMIFSSTKDILNLKDSFRNQFVILFMNHLMKDILPCRGKDESIQSRSNGIMSLN